MMPMVAAFVIGTAAIFIGGLLLYKALDWLWSAASANPKAAGALAGTAGLLVLGAWCASQDHKAAPPPAPEVYYRPQPLPMFSQPEEQVYQYERTPDWRPGMTPLQALQGETGTIRLRK